MGTPVENVLFAAKAWRAIRIAILSAPAAPGAWDRLAKAEADLSAAVDATEGMEKPDTISQASPARRLNWSARNRPK
jgi:hypothetical protein